MAEFKRLKDLGERFQLGIQAVTNNGGQIPVPRYKYVMDLDDALHRAGEQFEDHFRNKILNGGPGWAPLTEVTLEERARYGVTADDPLAETLQLYEAIKSRVTNNFTVEIGVEGEHHNRDGSGTFPMEVLVEKLEQGFVTAGTSKYPGKVVPARPLFSAPDFGDAEYRIVMDFAEYAIFGHSQGLYNFKAPRK